MSGGPAHLPFGHFCDRPVCHPAYRIWARWLLEASSQVREDSDATAREPTSSVAVDSRFRGNDVLGGPGARPRPESANVQKDSAWSTNVCLSEGVGTKNDNQSRGGKEDTYE
jgi:hypothetical protein